MGYADDRKTNQYEAVPTSDEPTKALDFPTIYQGVGPAKCGKKKRSKARRSLWLCCTNVEIENEKDNEKMLEFFKSNENGKRTCFVMCCTNIQVGSDAKV